MILTCPNCDAKFKIKDGALGSKGRKVKCSKCDHRWYAMPDGNAAAPPAPPPPPPEPEPAAEGGLEIDNTDPFANLDDDGPGEGAPPDAAQAAEEADAEGQPASRFEPPEPKRSISAIIGWIVFLLVIGAIVLGVVFFRKDFVAIYPPINKVFELIGIAPDTLGHGQKLPNPTSTPRREGNTNIIAVTGQIENTTKDTLDVPALRGDLFDSKNKATMTHFFKADQAKILPGEKITYKTEINNPPPGSVRLAITFTRDHPVK